MSNSLKRGLIAFTESENNGPIITSTSLEIALLAASITLSPPAVSKYNNSIFGFCILKKASSEPPDIVSPRYENGPVNGTNNPILNLDFFDL